MYDEKIKWDSKEAIVYLTQWNHILKELLKDSENVDLPFLQAKHYN